MHEGHRKRIMERLKREGGELQDHELLEILLFNALPRKNTNPLAHALIDSFGDLRGVLTADVDRLMTVSGVGEAVAEYLRCVGLLYQRIAEQEKRIPVLAANNPYEFAEYLKDRYRGLKVEVIDLFCLDSRGVVQGTKRFSSFDSGRVRLSSEEISRILVVNQPDGLLVAHNHPNAVSQPSKQDDTFTARLQMCCSMNKVELRDHIITGTDGVYSYFMAGRMETIRRDFSVDSITMGSRL